MWLMSLVLALCVCVSVASAASAGGHSRPGKRQAVREVYKTGTSHPKRFFAESTHDRNGRPVIIYYRRYATAPAHFQSFVRHHERCHQAGYRNEIAANCCAMRRMKLSGRRLAALRDYIIAHDVNSETVVDHPGQGASFWSKTASQCLGGAYR